MEPKRGEARQGNNVLACSLNGVRELYMANCRVEGRRHHVVERGGDGEDECE